MTAPANGLQAAEQPCAETTQTAVAPNTPKEPACAGPAPILVPLDGSGLAAAALPWAVALGRRRAAPLLLVCVVPPPGFPSPELAGSSAGQMILEAELAGALRYLRRAASGLAAGRAGVQAHTLVRVGNPAEELLRVEAERRPQLVVMTTHGRSGLRRWLRGSVADKVLRHGTAPVFLVRPGGGRSPAEPEAIGHRVLVAFDGSPAASAAATHAARLAREVAGDVALVGVIGPAAGDLARSVLEASLRAAARRVRQHGAAARTLVVASDDVAGAIVDAAAAQRADVIVMGTHGRDIFQHWLFGSVADRVAQAAPLPVLLVRPSATAAVAQTAAQSPALVA